MQEHESDLEPLDSPTSMYLMLAVFARPLLLMIVVMVSVLVTLIMLLLMAMPLAAFVFVLVVVPSAVFFNQANLA